MPFVLQVAESDAFVGAGLSRSELIGLVLASGARSTSAAAPVAAGASTASARGNRLGGVSDADAAASKQRANAPYRYRLDSEERARGHPF